MIKRICDICEREIPHIEIDDFCSSIIVPTEVNICREGRTLDICDACQGKIIHYVFHDMKSKEDPANL